MFYCHLTTVKYVTIVKYYPKDLKLSKYYGRDIMDFIASWSFIMSFDVTNLRNYVRVSLDSCQIHHNCQSLSKTAPVNSQYVYMQLYFYNMFYGFMVFWMLWHHSLLNGDVMSCDSCHKCQFSHRKPNIFHNKFIFSFTFIICFTASWSIFWEVKYKLWLNLLWQLSNTSQLSTFILENFIAFFVYLQWMDFVRSWALFGFGKFWHNWFVKKRLSDNCQNFLRWAQPVYLQFSTHFHS